MKTKNDRMIYIRAVLLSVIYIFVGNRIANINKVSYVQSYSSRNPVKLKVTQIIDEHYEETVYENIDYRQQTILFNAEIDKGVKKGTGVTCIQVIDDYYSVEQKIVEVGDKIIAYDNLYTDYRGIGYMFQNYYRFTYTGRLYIRFARLLVILGRRKGFDTLVTLVFTLGAIFLVFIPAVLNNGNIYLWSVSVCIFIIVMTLIIVNGATDKSFSAIIGCSSGILIAGALTFIVTHITHMTGMINDESTYLLFLNTDNPIDLKAVIFASIIFGAVGAVMDVAMSLAAALSEIKQQVPDITSKQLFNSGISIGRDMMGTMSNTLILAYIGSSMSVTLLLAAYNDSLMLLLNQEMILTELLEAVTGSLGILMTIPVTSFVCGFMLTNDGENTETPEKTEEIPENI